MLVILATQMAEIRRIQTWLGLKIQPKQIVHRPYLEKAHQKKDL
jgi:hypothetical protein